MMSPRRLRALAADEDGSVLPLILGYLLLAIAVIFVCVNISRILQGRYRPPGRQRMI